MVDADLDLREILGFESSMPLKSCVVRVLVDGSKSDGTGMVGKEYAISSNTSYGSIRRVALLEDDLGIPVPSIGVKYPLGENAKGESGFAENEALLKIILSCLFKAGLQGTAEASGRPATLEIQLCS